MGFPSIKLKFVHKTYISTARRVTFIEEKPSFDTVKTLISVRGMTKSFQDLVLFRNVNFDIFPGDKIGLVGSNGTGKSTLLKILLGREIIDVGGIEAKPDTFRIRYI